MSRRKSLPPPSSGVFTTGREKITRAVLAERPALGTAAADRARTSALLELARAMHHLNRAKTRSSTSFPAVKLPNTKVKGWDGGRLTTDPVNHVVRRARAALAEAMTLGEPTNEILSRASMELVALERSGTITDRESMTALERILDFYDSRRPPRVGIASTPGAVVVRALAALASGKNRQTVINHAAGELVVLQGAGLASTRDVERAFLSIKRASAHSRVSGATMNTDMPPELASYSDGVTDDAAYQPEIIGCQGYGLGVQGLGDIAVGAFPGYLFTKRNLRSPVIRRRLANAIKAMSPKMRRRVMHRLREVAYDLTGPERGYLGVQGEIRNAYPSISGAGWGAVSGSPSIAVGRCPYAGVAGALTP